MSSAKVTCATCSHQGAFHVLPVGACRRNGCPCEAFRDPAKPAKQQDEDERTVVIRVPEGYELHFQLVPVSDGS